MPSWCFAARDLLGRRRVVAGEEEVEDAAREEPDHHEDHDRDRHDRGDQCCESLGEEAVHAVAGKVAVGRRAPARRRFVPSRLTM